VPRPAAPTSNTCQRPGRGRGAGGHLPATLMKPHPQSWDFVYTLTVDDDAASHQVRFHTDAAPPALRELTDILNDLPPS
jgi:hypothetical protein